MIRAQSKKIMHQRTGFLQSHNHYADSNVEYVFTRSHL